MRAQLEYSNFSRVQNSDLTYPAVAAIGSSSLGNEVDLQFSVEPVNNIFMVLGGGVLAQGAAYGAGQSVAYMGFTSAQVNF